MKLQDALKLHNEDEVMVKRTRQVMKIVRTEVIPKENTSNHMTYVDIMLEDGNWYRHKEIS